MEPWAAGQRQLEIWMRSQEMPHHHFVLFRLERAGSVNESPTRIQRGSACLQQRLLQGRQLTKGIGSQAPANFGVSLKCSGARTRRVDQDLVEEASEGKLQGAIGGDVVNLIPFRPVQLSGSPQPMPVKIKSNHRLRTILESSHVRGLVSDTGAQV